MMNFLIYLTGYTNASNHQFYNGLCGLLSDKRKGWPIFFDRMGRDLPCSFEC